MTDQQPEPRYPEPPEPKPVSTPTIVLKWWHLLIAIVVVAVLSVGCTLLAVNIMRPSTQIQASGTTSQTNEQDGQQTQNDPEKNMPQSEKSERGFFVKRIGDEAGIWTSGGKSDIATWTLSSIETDVACTEPYGEPSENGHIVALTFDVETHPDFVEKHGYPLLLSAGNWRYYNSDGSLWNGNPSSIATVSCLPSSDVLPDSIGSGTTAHGKILFDLPSTDGILAFSEDGWLTGWEYPLKEHPTA